MILPMFYVVGQCTTLVFFIELFLIVPDGDAAISALRSMVHGLCTFMDCFVAFQLFSRNFKGNVTPAVLSAATVICLLLISYVLLNLF